MEPRWRTGGLSLYRPAGIFLLLGSYADPGVLSHRRGGHPSHDEDARQRAALRMFLYTQAGGLSCWLASWAGIEPLAGNANAHLRLHGAAICPYHPAPGPANGTDVVLFAGFAVKLPIVPLHGWLPDAHAHTPASGSVDLAGLLLKTAGYGMLVFYPAPVPRGLREKLPISPLDWGYSACSMGLSWPLCKPI